MKNMQRVLMAAGLITALAWGAVQALPPKGEGGKGVKAKAMERLGLSEDQVKKLEGLKDAKEDAVASLHDDLRKQMRTLRRQVRDEAADKDIQGTLSGIEKLHKSIRSEEEKFIESLKSVLTPGQQARMLLARVGRGPGPGGMRGRGPGPRGPQGEGMRPGHGPREDGEEGPEED
ncbi:MAG: hypothetical protein WC728_16910 [Elusimicrobiota bacterium]